ncbi:release factor glutamine methyltransferase [Polymorphobacter glacialis]|uniref:Release factor glutamine methyltransferase n=1 Tax=Sandarakinorhabdus glacialis TaxID=1614636 RepID=A0A916ZM45_9SPHN|nr:peptide chain release factor N(5)-glutamine methyltransferase [Polymorphobacter glacialis]GGE04309.1 release factor glutamine methyltransferase [Polymorphobacter glacialis]
MIVAEALRAAALRIDRFDAEVLLGYLLGVDRGALLLSGDRSIDPQAYDLLVARREVGEPVAYITGRREFWSLDLVVTPDVLIPRPDTETLIEAALAVCAAPATILDLGTGSGALLLAALSEWPAARGLGVDRSAAALAVAQGNAERLGFGGRADFLVGDWGQGIDRQFDLVLSNPPYVEYDAELSLDVRDHEPGEALFAGPDGLEDYRRLIPQLPGLLAPGGTAIIEIGWKQAAAVLALVADAGLAGEVRRDLAGRDRCVVLRQASRRS